MKENRKGKYSNPVTATLTGIIDLFRKQQDTVALKPEDSPAGKNILITGASSGLGFATAVELASKGANIWMACRSGIPDKGEKVKKLSGNNNIYMLPVDLSDLDSISSLVNRLEKHSVKLDILICNAGMVPARSRKTRQGLEEMFTVNYLAKYMLIRSLIDRNIFHTGDRDNLPRIIFVSSESHRNPKEFDWEGFGKYKDYSMGKTVELYGYYKLLMTTFANELARRLNPNGQMEYSVFALCPGPVNSNIAREAPAIFKPLLKVVFGIFFRSPGKAAKPVIYFTSSSEVKGKPIDYLFLMSRKEMDEKAVDPGNGGKLWKMSEVLLEKHGVIFTSLNT